MRISVLAGVFAAAFLAAPASAAPMAAEGLAVASPIVKVYGGCGPYGHRGYWVTAVEADNGAAGDPGAFVRLAGISAPVAACGIGIKRAF